MLLGLLFVTITGISWILAGALMSYVTAKNWNTYHYLMQTSIGGAVLCFAFMPFMGPEFSGLPSLTVCLLCFITGLVNIQGMGLISKAMSLGPNGLVWSLAQSALIFPFIMGICLGSVPTIIRICGALLIIAGIIAAGFARNTKAKAGEKNARSKKWLLVTLAAFMVIGLSQCLANLPSYFSAEDAGGGLWRGVIGSFGSVCSMLLTMLCSREARQQKCPQRLIFFSATLPCLIPGIIQNIFFYRGLDLLARANAGSIGYPLCTGICIAGFTIYTAIKLKEKFTIIALTSTLLCLFGIVAISL
jgi:multidrug transporter EmrE-like cation transporter